MTKKESGYFMPFVSIKTNVAVPKELDETLHSKLNAALALLDAVEDGWTMTEVQPECRLWFEGSNAPAAMVEVSGYGDILADCERVTAEVTRLLGEVLSVEPSRVYVKYAQAPYWGCGGENY